MARAHQGHKQGEMGELVLRVLVGFLVGLLFFFFVSVFCFFSLQILYGLFCILFAASFLLLGVIGVVFVTILYHYAIDSFRLIL